jgi:signal transduction histidine kinase
VIRSLGRAQLVFDLIVAGVLLLISVWSAAATRPVMGPVVVVLFCAALAVRRLSPTLSLIGVWVAALTQIAALVEVNGGNIAVFVVAYSTALYGRRAEHWLGLASAVVGGVIGAYYLTFASATSYFNPVYADARNLVSFVAIAIGLVTLFALSWTLGLLTRIVRQAREAKIEAAVAAQRAAYESVVEQERTRIARDMHDVVAHSLAVVIAQADGARYAGQTDPQVQSVALSTISTTARSALAEVRQLLTQLRHEVPDGPQPSFSQLPELLDGMRAAGLRITETTSGAPVPLLQVSEIAVYRVLQESLTNALRHGDPAGSVAVEWRWETDALHLRVRNPVRPTPSPLAPAASAGSGSSVAIAPALQAGHGLPGMRERAALAGGTLTAGMMGHAMFEVAMVVPAAEEEGQR